MTVRLREGWHGWDEYAPFYDWENARTLGRRDVAFWRGTVKRERGPVLELGCGTGRLLMPLARTGAPVLGIDRSQPMLAHARARAKRLLRRTRPAIVRGDIRAQPFKRASFGVVIAPYGMLQSLVRDRDVDEALREAARVLRRGGLLGIDLVPDLPRWDEYAPTERFRGRIRSGGVVTLVESVRQDRRRGLTIFHEQFTRQRGKTREQRKFTLTFRTLTMDHTIKRLAAAGFRVEMLQGDYRGALWHPGSEVWVILARKR